MDTQLPVWAQERLDSVLMLDEKVSLIIKGRIEVRSANFLSTIFYWIEMIIKNTVLFLFTMKFLKTAYLVLTENRIIILSEEGTNFPLWKIPYTRANTDYVIFKRNIVSINAVKNQILWFFFSNGFIIVESSGHYNRIINFNGVKKEVFNGNKKQMLSYIG